MKSIHKSNLILHMEHRTRLEATGYDLFWGIFQFLTISAGNYQTDRLSLHYEF